MCSQYIKIVLSNGNEIVMILPFLETVYNVRRILTENSTNINVRKYEKEQLLLILDSLKGYFGSPVGLMPFLSKYAKPYRAHYNYNADWTYHLMIEPSKNSTGQ